MGTGAGQIYETHAEVSKGSRGKTSCLALREGKTVSLDDLHEMVRTFAPRLGEDHRIVMDIRAAIGKAHEKRYELTDPDVSVVHSLKLRGVMYQMYHITHVLTIYKIYSIL